MRIKEVAEKTYWLETPISGVGLIFSAYLIDVDSGVLIEPGPTAAIPAIQEAMKQLGMHELSFIIPTHIHMDHAGGSGKLAQLFPQAKVIAHPLSARHIMDPSRLVQSTRITYGNSFESLYGQVIPVPKSQVKVPADEEMIPTGERELQIIHTPGHSPHHIAVFDQKTGGLFCGEALGMPTDDPLPAAAAPGFNMDDCLNTMKKLQSLNPRILFYSHGGVGQDPHRRIATAMENTRVFGQMILEMLKKGENLKTIGHKIRAFGASQFPPEWKEDMIQIWLTGMIEGYTLFFKNKGMA